MKLAQAQIGKVEKEIQTAVAERVKSEETPSAMNSAGEPGAPRS